MSVHQSRPAAPPAFCISSSIMQHVSQPLTYQPLLISDDAKSSALTMLTEDGSGINYTLHSARATAKLVLYASRGCTATVTRTIAMPSVTGCIVPALEFARSMCDPKLCRVTMHYLLILILVRLLAQQHLKHQQAKGIHIGLHGRPALCKHLWRLVEPGPTGQTHPALHALLWKCNLVFIPARYMHRKWLRGSLVLQG